MPFGVPGFQQWPFIRSFEKGHTTRLFGVIVTFVLFVMELLLPSVAKFDHLETWKTRFYTKCQLKKKVSMFGTSSAQTVPLGSQPFTKCFWENTVFPSSTYQKKVVGNTARSQRCCSPCIFKLQCLPLRIVTLHAWSICVKCYLYICILSFNRLRGQGIFLQEKSH